MTSQEIEQVMVANLDLNLWPVILEGGGALDVDVAPDCWERRAHISRYLFACQVFRNMRVLDFGCGVGYGSEMLAGVGNTVTGVDADANAVEKASARRGEIVFSTEVSRSDYFDGCVAFEVIEHLDNPQGFLDELSARHLVCSVPIVPTLATNPHHKQDFTEEQFLLMLEKQWNIRWKWRQTRPYMPDPCYLIVHAERKA